MKAGKAIGIIIFIALLLVGGGLWIGKIGVQSKNKQTTQTQKVVQSSNISKSSSSKKVEKSESSEKQVSEAPKQSKGVSESSTKKEDDKLTVASSSGERTLQDVGDISLKGDLKATGFIEDKRIYKYGSNYVFDLQIRLNTKEAGSQLIHYFTQSKNYKTLNAGDLLSVSYSISSDGTIAVISVDTVSN